MTAVTATRRRVAASALDHLDRIVATVAGRAADVDRGGRDVRAGIREVGAAGLLTLGVDGHGGTVAEQALVLRRLAAVCLSTAFSVWAQRMAVEYLTTWGGDPVRSELLPGLADGSRPGASALAPAFQDALGLRELELTATVEGDEVVLDGTIPWASNLFRGGAVVIVPARHADGRRSIVAATTDRIGDAGPAYPPLLALGGTASTSIHLHGVRVPASWVLTSRFHEFLAGVRPTFLLLQTALCLGLADAALAGAEGRCVGAAVVLAADHDQLLARRDRLDRDHHALLTGVGSPAPDDLVRLRLAAGTLAVDAVRHEATLRGGAGFLATSPVARRLREAAFLPILSPTEAQLRWELSRPG